MSPRNNVQKIRNVPIVVKFQNVVFENNSVTGDGGAVWLNVWFIEHITKPAAVHFEDCTFRANSAAFRGGALWFGSRIDKMIQFQNCSFHENRAYAPDAGQGGAVFCTAGKIIIKNSYFQGNSASKRGGTMHIEGDSSLNIADSTFENSHTSLKGIEGDVMFVDQKQTLFTGKITFDLQSANYQKSIFVFKGRPRILRMINSTTRFICPKGYNYEEIALDTKMIRRGLYHLFAFRCKPCQDLYYSVERGSQHVNGSKYWAKCYKCPYGASCNGTIRAKANFWGMVQGDRVEMVACPRGYCCDREPCLSYDTCRSHRTGTLCGRCEDGFSEGIGSTVCYPNEQCTSKSAWWPPFCVVAIFAFFLFQQETLTKLGKCLLLNNEIPYRPQSQIQGEEDGDNEHDDEDEDESREISERFSDNVRLSLTHQDHNRIEESESFNNTGGYIKVFFYFYQAVFLLRFSSYSSQSSFPNLVIEFVLPFLNFQFSDEFSNCLIKDLTPVGKAYFKNSVGCCVLSLGLVSYLFYMLIRRCKFGSYNNTGFEARSFPVRLIGAVVQIILQSYVALTLLAVQLLHCVELDGHHVLHIDGNVVCYTEASQILMWLFSVFFIVSFPFVLIFGRRLLLSDYLTPGRFVFACFVPLPFLAYWGWLYWREGFGKDNGQVHVAERNHYKDKILYILQHPYKPPDPHAKRPVVEHLIENWESVLILRRLALVLVVVFADSILLRAHLLFFLSLAILLLHVVIQPFVNKDVNQCEIVSLGVIVLFSGLDIAEPAFSYAGESGPTSLAVIQAMENWIVALLPAFILVAFLYPRAKFHFARLCQSRPSSFQSLQDTEMDI